MIAKNIAASTPPVLVSPVVRSAERSVRAGTSLSDAAGKAAAQGTSGALREAALGFEKAGKEFRDAGSLYRAVSDDHHSRSCYEAAEACYRAAARAASKTTMTHPVAYLVRLADEAHERA